MKAITVWQPWAALIAIGAKSYEFRGWYPPESMIGQRIAIHAAARKISPAEIRLLRCQVGGHGVNPCLHIEKAQPLIEKLSDNPGCLPLSHVVCTAVLGTPKRGDECAAEFGGGTNDSNREGTFNWGWPMLDVQPLEPPAPAKGAQGFWNWDGQ